MAMMKVGWVEVKVVGVALEKKNCGGIHDTINKKRGELIGYIVVYETICMLIECVC